MLKIHHVAFEVSDIAKSVYFYTEILGLKLCSINENLDQNISNAFLEFDGGSLELLQINDKTASYPYPESEFNIPYTPHIAFEIQDIGGWVKELPLKGVNHIIGPYVNHEGVQWAYFQDPDGNIIELIQPKFS